MAKCPMMQPKPVENTGGLRTRIDLEPRECMRHECELWVTTITTEGIGVAHCGLIPRDTIREV